MNATNWKQEREKAAWRRRRIIMNNDGDDVSAHISHRPVSASGTPPDSPEAFWARRCTGMEESQIDTVFYCTGGNFNQHQYDTKIAELPDDGDGAGLYVHANYARAYIAQGRDCLQLIIDFCRRHGREVFWSLRMNDFHDNWYPAHYPRFKRDHPELLIFQPADIGKPRVGLMEPHMNATAVDYGRHEVRDRQFAIAEEVCSRYDIDGLEMDFMRQPIFFRPTLEGRPVAPEHLETMTAFLHRIRDMTEEHGRKRGRPILVACRVASTLRCNTEIGLDIERWLAEDLIDLVVTSLEFEPFTGPARELAELGHRHRVPVYAGLTAPRDTHWVGIGPLEGWRAAAASAWNAGVDGIYTFNLFDPGYEVFRTVGDPAVLEKMDKTYAVDNIAGRFRTWEHVLPPEGRLPLELSPGTGRCVVLPVGDDVAARSADGVLAGLSLRIYMERLTYSDDVEFRLNGAPLEAEVVSAAEGVSPVACGEFLLKALPDPLSIRPGENTFEALLRKRCQSAPGMPAVASLQLLIRYKR